MDWIEKFGIGIFSVIATICIIAGAAHLFFGVDFHEPIVFPQPSSSWEGDCLEIEASGLVDRCCDILLDFNTEDSLPAVCYVKIGDDWFERLIGEVR